MLHPIIQGVSWLLPVSPHLLRCCLPRSPRTMLVPLLGRCRMSWGYKAKIGPGAKARENQILPSKHGHPDIPVNATVTN